MSRKAAAKVKTRSPKRSSTDTTQQTNVSKPPQRPLHGLLMWLLGWPRLTRIAFVAITSLLMAFLLTPLLTDLHWRLAFTLDTYYAPAIVTMLFACIMYLAGWQLVVGTPGETPQLRPALFWYFGVMLLVLLISLVWIVTTAIPAFMEA